MSSFVNLLDIIYPVNSIYQSFDATSPAETVGGTWERISSRFIYGTSDDSALLGTSGESSHTLTVNEMPSHTHNTGKWTLHDVGSWGARNGATFTSSSNPYSNSAFDVNYTGGGAAHNNMPPYIKAAIWRRTA